jgi:DNA-binding protein HU-beta
MNKAELAKEISQSVDLTQESAKNIIETIVTAITKSLKKGDKVQLSGFGSWEVRTKNKRQGRNPKTGESITIPAKKVVRFKAGKDLAGTVKK